MTVCVVQNRVSYCTECVCVCVENYNTQKMTMALLKTTVASIHSSLNAQETRHRPHTQASTSDEIPLYIKHQYQQKPERERETVKYTMGA